MTEAKRRSLYFGGAVAIILLIIFNLRLDVRMIDKICSDIRCLCLYGVTNTLSIVLQPVLFFLATSSRWTTVRNRVIIASLDPFGKKSSTSIREIIINNRKIEKKIDRKTGTGSPDISFQQVQYISIDADHEGRRIDNFLFNFLKSVPKGRVYKMIRKGEVRVNKKRIKTNYKLILGDSLRIPPVFVDDKAELQIPHRVIEQLRSATLYEDDAFLIINKPSGIPVHAGSGCVFGVIESFRAMDEFKDGYIELAHRLDRETSGCLILVKKPQVLRDMNKLIKDNQMSKRYLALVKGIWEGGRQMVDAPLLKNIRRGGERVVQVSEEGKTARTEFDLQKGFAEASLLEVTLHTGRTHQIRVHSTHIGTPIAGDNKYGDDGFNKTMKTLGLKRLFLHASHLSFTLGDMQKISVDAPLSDELKSVINKLS